MTPGEYQAGLRGDSWKLDLIQAINEALEYAVDRESFIENMEALFAYRRSVGFYPGSVEPDEGWLGEAASGLLRLGKELEQQADLPPLPAPPGWTDRQNTPPAHWAFTGVHWRPSTPISATSSSIACARLLWNSSWSS